MELAGSHANPFRWSFKMWKVFLSTKHVFNVRVWRFGFKTSRFQKTSICLLQKSIGFSIKESYRKMFVIWFLLDLGYCHTLVGTTLYRIKANCEVNSGNFNFEFKGPRCTLPSMQNWTITLCIKSTISLCKILYPITKQENLFFTGIQQFQMPLMWVCKEKFYNPKMSF